MLCKKGGGGRGSKYAFHDYFTLFYIPAQKSAAIPRFPAAERWPELILLVAVDDRSEHSATPTTRFTQRRRAGTDRDVGVDTSG